MRGVRAALIHDPTMASGTSTRGRPSKDCPKTAAKPIGLQKRRAQRLDERHVVQVGIRIVAEGAGFNVAPGIYVQEAPAGADTAVRRMSVVPEIYDGAVAAQAVVRYLLPDVCPLLRIADKGEVCAPADRHVIEQPAEPGALLIMSSRNSSLAIVL